MRKGERKIKIKENIMKKEMKEEVLWMGLSLTAISTRL